MVLVKKQTFTHCSSQAGSVLDGIALMMAIGQRHRATRLLGNRLGKAKPGLMPGLDKCGVIRLCWCTMDVSECAVDQQCVKV